MSSSQVALGSVAPHVATDVESVIRGGIAALDRPDLIEQVEWLTAMLQLLPEHEVAFMYSCERRLAQGSTELWSRRGRI